MASRIKGITIEIGGDTMGLDKALKSVNSSITHLPEGANLHSGGDRCAGAEGIRRWDYL